MGDGGKSPGTQVQHTLSIGTKGTEFRRFLASKCGTYGRSPNLPGVLPLLPLCVTGAKPRAACCSGGLSPAADQVWQVGNERLACHVEPAAEVVPERDGILGAALGQPEKGIAAIASGLAASAGTDLAADHLAADVVFRAIGVRWYLRPLQHHQQLGLVGMQPRQEPIERGKAGAAAEDAVEA